MSALLLILGTISLQLQSVKNFRLALPPVNRETSGNRLIYRSGNLDEILVEDAEALVRLNPLIIDLRNHGEGSQAAMASGTVGSRLLYSSSIEVVKLPLIISDRFWPRVEKELSFGEALRGNLRSVIMDRGFERQLALKLEEKGLGLLYKVIADTASTEIGEVLSIVCEQVIKDKPVLFHCAKGKDRTGVIAALLMLISGKYSEEQIIEQYTLSEKLLGEEKGSGKAGDGVIDWRKLRGSPPLAMKQFLHFLKEEGGFREYLTSRAMFESSRSLDELSKIL
jgi:hypothetical protein